MKRMSLIVLGLLLLTLIIGLAPAALIWEAAGRSREPTAMKWVLTVYIVFLAAVHILFLAAVKLGVFRNIESPKYHLMDIDETDYYTPEGTPASEEVAHDPAKR